MSEITVWMMVLALLLGATLQASDASNTKSAFAMEKAWSVTAFGRDMSARPFSFVYGGRSSSELLKRWKSSQTFTRLDRRRDQKSLTYTDPETGLEVRCVVVRYRDYPAVEWTLHFRNTGTADTPIIEDIRAIDSVFHRSGPGEFVLHHHRGDDCSENSFAPIRTVLAPGTQQAFAPYGGRSSNGQWPYYNIEWDGGGVMMAIGWPGQWASKFTRDGGTGLRVQAGQELTHFRLHPGEEVRSPLIALLFYKGDRISGQNVWRRWMFDHNFPKDHGEDLAPAIAGCSFHQFSAGQFATQDGEIEFITRYFQEGVKLDYWWVDAGWYPCEGVGWGKVGTWEVDKKRYPGGLRAVSDFAHSKGVRLITWFEPERVAPDTWLDQNHPEWLLPPGKNEGWGKLLNMGNSEARAWITDRVDKLITEQGIDLYRQDFNMDPLGYWRENDTEDRKGITEIRHVEGYLAYWDELRRRHPGMLIDSCASGGRRNDLETMRRAVPLLRTDAEFHSEANQCHTYGFDMWLPYHELANKDIDPYCFRSNMAIVQGLVWDVRKTDLNYDLARRLVAQWREVADCYSGDFYPLTDFSTARDVWMAWQFHRPDKRKGMVQVFRRPECSGHTLTVKLRGLSPSEHYLVRNLDEEKSVKMTGRELMTTGLTIRMQDKPGAAIIAYHETNSPTEK